MVTASPPSRDSIDRRAIAHNTLGGRLAEVREPCKHELVVVVGHVAVVVGLDVWGRMR
jgi:hypothetical protein